MAVIVQKFGGTSVGSPEKLRQVAQRVAHRAAAGDRLVVVVSAMGHTTDELLELARAVSPNPPRRELDMLLTAGERISMALLSMALHDLGVPAISFTGSQSGIITTDEHTNARIVEVRPHRIREALEQGRVVIVAGFQGVSARREVTTLGRGGSDTSAVALAAALSADACEIFSDVDGVFSADPRVVPQARRLAELSYEEMQELSECGARVLNAQAVEFARAAGIEIRALATAGGEGTRIGSAVAPDVRRSFGVAGVTGEQDMVLLGLQGGVAPAEVLAWFAGRQSYPREAYALPGADVWVRLCGENLHGLESLVEALRETFGAVARRDDLGHISAVGTGLGQRADAATAMLDALRREGLTPAGWLHTSQRLQALLPRKQVPPAVRAVHAALCE